MTAASEKIQTMVSTLGIQCIDRHIFICADQTKPKCCPKDDSITAWNYLKKRLKELNLDSPQPSDTGEAPTPHIFRTKANCLRVCMDGPILLVYSRWHLVSPGHPRGHRTDYSGAFIGRSPGHRLHHCQPVLTYPSVI